MADRPKNVRRVQSGVRIDAGLLKVLKGLAVSKGMALNELMEGILLHALEGKLPFGDETLTEIEELKRIYRVELTAADSHRLVDLESPGEKR